MNCKTLFCLCAALLTICSCDSGSEKEPIPTKLPGVEFIQSEEVSDSPLTLAFSWMPVDYADNYKYSLYEFVEDYSSQTGTDGTDIEFTINLGCGDSGQYTCYNKTIDGTQYLASPIITDRNGKNVTSGTLKFASDGFKLTIPDYCEGQYLTYGLFEYGTKTFADKTDKGYISLADLSVVRK